MTRHTDNVGAKGIVYMDNKSIPACAIEENNAWHILIHPNPSLMEKVFKTKQSESYNPMVDEGLLPPCDYYIPFNEIGWRPSQSQHLSEDMDDKIYNPVMDGNALRSDFHSFLFVYGNSRLVHQIVDSRLNRSLRIPIRRYLDTDGHPVSISAEEMNRFKSAVMRQDFQICQGYPLQEIVQGDKVVVVDGPMKGGVGDVMEIRYDQEGMKLTIAFLMFNNSMTIAVPGFRAKNVRLQNPDTTQLLQDPMIANFENELIELLHHRYGAKGSATLSPEDEKRLRYLYHYSDIVFENDDVSTAKFTALMLICVYLLKDKEATEQYIQRVNELLQGATEAKTALQAYLFTALFIATHAPMLRKSVKTYRQTHPNCPKPICRFLSIAKRI